MNTTDLTITIPAAIHNQPGLTLVEKAALAFIHKHPACSNQGLARLLGFKVRGVEALLKRFRAQGLIVQRGQGRARSHRLTFEVEPRIPRGNSAPGKSLVKRGPANPLESLKETYDSVLAYRQMARTCIQYSEYAAALDLMMQIEDCVRQEHFLLPEEKEKIIRAFNGEKIVARALAATSDHLLRLPQREQARIVQALCNSSPETLASVQERLDAPGALSHRDALSLAFKQ